MKNEGLRYSLYIPHGIQPGRYTIRIDDGHGQESSCQVSVEGMSISFSRGKFNWFCYWLDTAENERKKPRIIRGLTDMTIQEGESMELECQFEGDDVEATWFFDGIMLRSNVFTTINFKPNDLAQLLMKEVYFEDAGLYKLRLRNKYGEVSTSCTVSIRQRDRSTDQRKMSTEDLPPK